MSVRSNLFVHSSALNETKILIIIIMYFLFHILCLLNYKKLSWWLDYVVSKYLSFKKAPIAKTTLTLRTQDFNTSFTDWVQYF